MSVDIAMPQPCMAGCPALTTRKMAMGTTMPASPTSSGSVSLLPYPQLAHVELAPRL